MKNVFKNDENSYLSTEDSDVNEESIVNGNVSRLIEFIYSKAPSNSNELSSIFQNNIKKIDMNSYLLRYTEYLSFNDNQLIISVIYFDIFWKKNRQLFQKKLLLQVFIICLKWSEKYLNDKQNEPKIFSKVCGINYNKLFKLESYLLNLIEWDLYISDIEFKRYYKKLNKI